MMKHFFDRFRKEKNKIYVGDNFTMKDNGWVYMGWYGYNPDNNIKGDKQ